MAGRDALTTTGRTAALRRQTIHPLESRQRFAPAAMDRLGPLPHARRLATRPRPLPDAVNVFGGEVSFYSLPLAPTSLDYHVGAREQRRWNFDTQRVCRL